MDQRKWFENLNVLFERAEKEGNACLYEALRSVFPCEAHAYFNAEPVGPVKELNFLLVGSSRAGKSSFMAGSSAAANHLTFIPFDVFHVAKETGIDSGPRSPESVNVQDTSFKLAPGHFLNLRDIRGFVNTKFSVARLLDGSVEAFETLETAKEVSADLANVN